MSPLRSGLQWLALQSMLLLLGALSLAWNGIALALWLVLPRDTGRRVGRAAIAHGYGFYWAVARAVGIMRLHIEALDVLRGEAGLVIVANHPSMIDAMLLVARLPRSFCVMKASLMHNPFLGPGARLARYVLNDSPRALVVSAVEELRAGGQLVMFPEGTRTTEPPVNVFRPGFALIAKMAHSPIQTVFIDTPSPYLGKAWPIWRLPPLPVVFSLRLGRRFEPAEDHMALSQEIEGYFRSAMAPAAAP